MDSPTFWDELFLLKVNYTFLERCVQLTSEEQLLLLKDNVSLIFRQCCYSIKDFNLVRVKHSLETLSILLKCIFKKKFNNFGLDILTILTTNIENADKIFKELIFNIQQLLLKSDDIVLIQLGIEMLITIVTATDNINQNTLIEYFMMIDISACLQKLISSDQCTFESLFLLSLLSHYRIYESQNIYSAKISDIHSPEVLQNILKCISQIIVKCISDYDNTVPKSPEGILSKLVGFVGGMWYYSDSSDNSKNNTSNISTSTSISTSAIITSVRTGPTLFILYQFLHLNKHFMKHIRNCILPSTTTTTTTITTTTTSNNNNTTPSSAPLGSSILPDLLTLISYIFSDVREMRSVCYCKLSMILLLVVCEDKNLCNIIHDKTHPFTLKLYNKSKKTVIESTNILAVHIIELITSFIKINAKKNKIETELLSKALQIIQRILNYQHSNKVNIEWKWQEYWGALFQMTNIIYQEQLYEKIEYLSLIINIGKIFNIFITNGETLLTPDQYDDLFYEIIRHKELLQRFYSSVNSLESGGENSLLYEWMNVFTIEQHFSNFINSWCDQNPGSTMSSQQVKGIIRSNYDSLRLSLNEKLLYYDPYCENPKEVNYFRHLLRLLVFDW